MSRNTLFLHLRNNCWKTKNEPSKTTSDSPKAALVADACEHFATPSLKPTSAPPKPSAPRVIESTALPYDDHPLGYTFRSSEYTTSDVSFSPAGPKLSIYLDSGCPITLGDREFLRQYIPDFKSKVKHMASYIPVRGFSNKVSAASEFLDLNLYIDSVDNQGPTTAKLAIEVHITDNLKANMLMGTGVLKAHGILLDLGTQSTTITRCNSIKIPIYCVAKPHSQLRRIIKIHHIYTVAPNSVIDIPIIYHSTIPNDRNFLFEPQSYHKLGHKGSIYTHVVDSIISFVKVKNSTPRPIKLSRHARLGTIVEYNAHSCYMVSPEAESLATCGWRVPGQSDSASLTSSSPSIPSSIQTDPSKEHPLPNGVTVYGDHDAAIALADLISGFEDVFTDLGKTVDIPEEQ